MRRRPILFALAQGLGPLRRQGGYTKSEKVSSGDLPLRMKSLKMAAPAKPSTAEALDGCGTRFCHYALADLARSKSETAALLDSKRGFSSLLPRGHL